MSVTINHQTNSVEPSSGDLSIGGSGNVGIGTSSPNYKLETKDGDIAAVKLTSAAGGNAVNGMRFRVNNSANTAQSATLGMINAETASAWGGVLTFSTKTANGSPNETVTERMRVDAAGRVTMPSQPAFTAQPTSFTGSGGIAGTPTFIFATALLNIGGHFNTSNGRFTAPVAGNYFFTYSITASSSSKSARYFRVRLAKNGTTVLNPHNAISDETGNADYNSISASGLVAMNANDYVELNYGSSIDASGLVFYDNMNTFSGFLMS